MRTSGQPPAAADCEPMHLSRGQRRLSTKVAAAAFLSLAMLLGTLAVATPAGARFGWRVTLTASPTSGLTGAPATLTAAANKPLTPRHFIVIWRAGRVRVLKTCTRTPCTVKVTPPGDANPSPAPTTTYTTYKAQIVTLPRRHLPPGRALANAKVKVGRTGPTCHPPGCPTM